MNSLDQEQQRLKAEMDERKARHPFPGGWRENSLPTKVEEAVHGVGIGAEMSAVAKTAGLIGASYLFPDKVDRREFSLPDYNKYSVFWRSREEFIVREGRVYVTKGGIVERLTISWTYPAAKSFLKFRPNICRLRVSHTNVYYCAAEVIQAIRVMKKPRSTMIISPSVARVLQGSLSINEALLAFIQNGAE